MHKGSLEKTNCSYWVFERENSERQRTCCVVRDNIIDRVWHLNRWAWCRLISERHNQIYPVFHISVFLFSICSASSGIILNPASKLNDVLPQGFVDLSRCILCRCMMFSHLLDLHWVFGIKVFTHSIYVATLWFRCAYPKMSDQYRRSRSPCAAISSVTLVVRVKYITNQLTANDSDDVAYLPMQLWWPCHFHSECWVI